MRIAVTAFFLLLLPAAVQSQTNWRSWASAGVNISFTKKLDLRLSHLRSYNLQDSFTNNFNQTSASLEYDLTKKLSLSGGAMLTQLPASGNSTQRYYARGTYKISVADMLTWSNALQAELHSANETRFRNRFVYITRISNKRRFSFAKLSLAASYWLYYNMGGNAIRYYDKTGAVISRQSPDGLHRSRLYLNANSKLTKNLSVSLYYMRQQEFNLFTPETRKLNIINPSTGKISRAFDNYNVAGITLSYNINLY